MLRQDWAARLCPTCAYNAFLGVHELSRVAADAVGCGGGTKQLRTQLRTHTPAWAFCNLSVRTDAHRYSAVNHDAGRAVKVATELMPVGLGACASWWSSASAILCRDVPRWKRFRNGGQAVVGKRAAGLPHWPTHVGFVVFFSAAPPPIIEGE